RNRAGFPECSIPHLATFREAACARPAALGSPAIQSIWRAPAETIPSAAAGQAHTHPCGPSSRSSPTRPPSHAASPAERFQIPLADNGPASSPIRSTGTPSSLKKQTRASGSLATFASLTILPRPSTTQPLESSRDTSIPHNVPRLSSISDAWGRLTSEPRFIIYRGTATFTPCSERGPLWHLVWAFRRRVNHLADLSDLGYRKTAEFRVLADDVLIFGKINAERLVVGNIGFKRLDVRTKLVRDTIRFSCDSSS